MAHNKNHRTMSLMRSSSIASSLNTMSASKGATLASIYQARKSGKEDTKVEVLRQQFQTQIERRITTTSNNEPTSKLLNRSHIPSRHEQEVYEFRKLEREKSFDEARTAVQSQIEKIFMKTTANNANNNPPSKRQNHERLSRIDSSSLAEKNQARVNGGLTMKRRLPSIDAKHRLNIENGRARSSSAAVASRNPAIDVKSKNASPTRRNNNLIHSRYDSTENLTPVKPHKYQGARRARDLEQHLKDKYGLPDNQLRRANSHSSLTQFAPGVMMRTSQTLTRRKSHGVLNEPEHKSLKVLTAHQHEPRDSKLRYLGRMSPEEQVDKYLKSMEKLKQQKLEYRTIYDPNRVGQRVNTSISSRWHSLDSVSRPALVRGMNSIMSNNNGKIQSHSNQPAKKPAAVSRLVNAKPVLPLRLEKEVVATPTTHNNHAARERTDIPKSFASMPQISKAQHASSPTRAVSKSPEEKMSTSSDHTKSRNSADSPQSNQYISEDDNEDDDYVDSCSCTDVTLDETLKINHNHRKSLARKRQLQAQRLQELQKADQQAYNGNGTHVSYLGSITLDSKSSDLLALQKPLKSLYFKYVIARQAGLDSVPGNIEITSTGLKIIFSRNGQKQEIFNVFTSIAVWAAVRFVHKDANLNKSLISTSVNNSGQYYAFLPLITDPGDEARNRLFCPLAKSELKYTKRPTTSPQHPPMFACITRKTALNGSDQELECHGFVCRSSDEAVSIAAQLYQSLIETIKTQGPKKRIRLSRASSVSMGSVTSYDDDHSNANIVEDPPMRPERKKKSSASSSPSKMSISSSDQASNGHVVIKPRLTGSIRRRNSRRNLSSRKKKKNVNQWRKKSDESSSPNSQSDTEDNVGKIVANNGDIYTKVTMPKSKSFMKLNNNPSSNQYNLQELFKELKEQHGIASIDDLLRQVVKPEGMSFNKIEPVYRELLLKLVMSMSKDEIFIRSKTIMDEEKDKKKALLLMGGSKLLNNKALQKDSSGRFPVMKEPSVVEEPIKDKSLGNFISKATKRTFLMRRKNSLKKVSVKVGGKTTSGSISRRLNSSKRKRSNIIKSTNQSPSTASPKLLTKFDIGSPMPLVQGARDEVAKKWMLGDIKDIKLIDDAKSGPDSGITSGGQTMKSSNTSQEKSNCCSECGYASDQNHVMESGKKSACSCSMFGTVTPASRSVKSRAAPPSSTCSTCYCQTCGEDSASATCYSCGSEYSSGLERQPSIKSISRIGERTLALIDTDSDSSLGSFGSIESPKTAWRKMDKSTKNVIEDTQDDEDDTTSIMSDSSVASVIEAVKKATETGNSGRGEANDGYYRKPNTVSAAGAIYGFTLKRKQDLPGSPSLQLNSTTRSRPSFRQYNATVTSRQSHISLDSLTSPLSSLTLLQGQNGSSNNIDSTVTTLNRNRGPRPAYSDANMQHSLGYLP